MLALAACAAPLPPPGPARPAPPPEAAAAALPPRPSPREAVQNFLAVLERMEPVAEAACRARMPAVDCDFLVLVDDRPGQPPNAFQTVTPEGRPVIVFTLALIAEARNADELAFVFGHEAGHHIAGHLPRLRQAAITGGLILGTLAGLGGAGEAGVRRAVEIGAQVGARRYGPEFELEADAIGTELAFRAGFDPERGAAFFERLPDPGNRFLATHPPNAARIATVRRTLALLRAEGVSPEIGSPGGSLGLLLAEW